MTTVPSASPNPSTYREMWSGFDLDDEGAILLTHESGFYKNEFFGPHKENAEYWESLLDADTTTTPIGVAVLVETSPASGTTPARHHVVVLHSVEKVKSLRVSNVCSIPKATCRRRSILLYYR